jgi:hypothetical protein
MTNHVLVLKYDPQLFIAMRELRQLQRSRKDQPVIPSLPLFQFVRVGLSCGDDVWRGRGKDVVF